MLDHKTKTLNRARGIRGWLLDAEMEWLYDRASERRFIFEIGSYMGKSTTILANAVGLNPLPRTSAISGLELTEPILGGMVITCDHFRGPDVKGDDSYHFAPLQEPQGREQGIQTFLNNTYRERECGKLLFFDLDSISSSIYLQPLVKYRRFDMIFIDGSHDEVSVTKDIEIALRLAQKGGLICGHDFKDDTPGVPAAVNCYFPQRELVPKTSIWYIYNH